MRYEAPRPLYFPDTGSLGMHQVITVQHIPERRLSKETPIYDHLNIRPFHTRFVHDLTSNPQADTFLYVLGNVSASKELLLADIHKRQTRDKRLRKLLDPFEEEFGPISYTLMTTPMANYIGTEEGSIKGAIGSFRLPEVLASDLVYDRESEKGVHGVSKPALHYREGGLYGGPQWPFSLNHLKQSVERARQDPERRRIRAIYIVPERRVQDVGMSFREAIAMAHDPEEAEQLVKARGEENNVHVIFDRNAISPEKSKRSWGNKRARALHDVLGAKHAVREMQRIQAIDPTIPDYSWSDLWNPDKEDLRIQVDKARAVLMLTDAGLYPDEFIVRENRYIANLKVKYDRSVMSGIGLVDVPWLQSDI